MDMADSGKSAEAFSNLLKEIFVIWPELTGDSFAILRKLLFRLPINQAGRLWPVMLMARALKD